MNRIEVNLTTGEQKIIPLTVEEIEEANTINQHWQTQQATQQAAATAKASAVSKLTTLGLTEAEITALIG